MLSSFELNTHLLFSFYKECEKTPPLPERTPDSFIFPTEEGAVWTYQLQGNYNQFTAYST